MDWTYSGVKYADTIFLRRSACYLITTLIGSYLTVDAYDLEDPYPRKSADSSQLLYLPLPFRGIRGGFAPSTASQSVTLILKCLVSSHTFDNRGSVNTLHTSSCFTTNHGQLPSQSCTRETGFVARSLANSTGGSAARGRANGKCGTLD